MTDEELAERRRQRESYMQEYRDAVVKEFGSVYPDTVYRCAYCRAACDGTKHDHYGEHVLVRVLVVCDECDEDLSHEDGPWNEVR